MKVVEENKKVKQKENIHSGHRARMRAKVESGHLGFLADHEILEILLFNVVPRADVNKLSHNILLSCGSLQNMFCLTVEKLQAINGVGKNIANYIVVLGEAYKRALINSEKLVKIDNSDKLRKYVQNLYKFENEEKVYLICIDIAFKVINTLLISEGDSSSSSINIQDVCRKAILSKAKFVILTHNHINSSEKPSLRDCETTKELMKKLYLSGVLLLDHIITNGTAEFSFRSENVFDKWFKEIDVRYEDIKNQFKLSNFDVASNDANFSLYEFLMMNSKI